MYYPVFRQDTQQQLKQIGSADLVIGLPTYKNASSAALAARIALEGVHQYYPDLKTVLLNADAGLDPATRQAVAAQASTNGHNSLVVTGRYEGRLGYGSATAALLDAALALDAKAILILDSSTPFLAPNWIAGLTTLVLDNKADLVMPRYHWALPAGALSDLVAYPLSRALWGQTVRHPTAPDFALSPQLAAALLDEDVWDTEVSTYGLSPWLTTYAILNRWRVAQTALGQKKSGLPLFADSSAQPAQTANFGLFQQLFHDIVSVLFRQAYTYRHRWSDVDQFHMFSTLTEFAGESNLVPLQEKDPTPFLDELALGWIEYRALWRRILTDENLTRIEHLASLRPDRFYFPADLWARVIYDFVVIFNKGDSDPYQVVRSLYPLYLGRLAAFWQEVAGLALVGYEGTVAAQVVEFEEARSYLKIRWHTYPPWLYGNDEIW